MYKSIPLVVLTAVAAVATPVSGVAAQRLMAPLSAPSAADSVVPEARLMLAGGMGGMTGGGSMGGMTGGGSMGGMTGGGSTSGGGMGGVTGRGMGGMADGGTPAYGGAAGFDDTSGSDGHQWSGSSYAGGEEGQQYYHCIAQHGQCSVAASPGSVRHGASCTCLFGGRGTIK